MFRLTEDTLGTAEEQVVEETTGPAGPLTVEEVQDREGQVIVRVEDVSKLQFDQSTGFHVIKREDGTAFVELGSSFADIFVSGSTTLEAAGEDALELIAGDGVSITTTTEHTGSTSKAITISSKNPDPMIIAIDASDDSPELDKFLDILENPCNYKGKVVYLTAVGPTERPDPFLWADKFYFNEGCEWYESPFALGSILNDLD